jgi:hypothetical protein
MPKVSKTTAATQVSVPGWMDAAMADVDGYSVEIERYDGPDMDFAFAYKGLPNDQCQAHHVAYILNGKITVKMADGSEEVFEAGDAVVMKPGHIPTVASGTEYVMFTPAEEANAMAPVVQANMAKYMQEHGIELPS